MNKSDLNLCYKTDLKRLLMIYDNRMYIQNLKGLNTNL